MNGSVKNSIFKEESQFEHEIQRSRKVIKSFKAKADRGRSLSEKFADQMTSTFGTVFFLSLNMVLFTLWILINIGQFPEIKPFDPFPFSLLTMIVSLQAIALAIIVLISQNRTGKVDELREEIDYQLGIIAEQEVTKLLYIVAKIAEKNGIDLSKDIVLQEMLRPTNTDTIGKSLERQIEKYDSSIIPLKQTLSKVLNKEILNKEINLPSL
ncbi:MAG: hypothetical protein ACD_50C00248G0001 [uncultured bacterium]|nr:MAG: hypothetical protein ACD_50C00248G0001 [uncultured bacterium]KKR16313.1 MAG: hypothetical protein UT46_C0006G0006 [Candidatus Levybacteria bacterium GW2011_GWA1_39_34]KKR50831.1 MAG: hypothetical protein UT87_C0011G0009 [Candidatus Levybacteria bacterium GW2011_GWC1_40_19]KKR95266.1 MAG: hypothetical protein UU45_C0003G0052 [Candidatus Levybacteria bacterium GW2011_GWA2_41_15]KKS01778.1 MAG: hypothetical protein UU52_C0007G0008 [Candidatus Levybacteria bacterium GW2011_GWB1_41_21]OGH20